MLPVGQVHMCSESEPEPGTNVTKFGLGLWTGRNTRDREEFGWSSIDIYKEYIVTGGGIGWTVPRVDHLGRSRYGCPSRSVWKTRSGH